MSGLHKRLESLIALPSRDSSDFDSWLEQEDAIAFIEQNAHEAELVIYASLPCLHLHSVLVPVAKLDPLNVEDLLRWSCHPDSSWSIWTSNDSVRLSPPLDNPGCETLKGGEQLIFTRTFAGRLEEKSYVEVLQKFAHVLGLHHVPERKAWCRIDQHGDVEDLVRVVSTPLRGKLNGDRYVTVARPLLDEYMRLTGAALVRLCDVLRIRHESFSGWTQARPTVRIYRGELHADLTIDPDDGSYLRGFQIVRSSATDKTVMPSLWGDNESKQYATFIANDWKNQVIKEISCDPRCLANYFTKSDLPFEITPAFFKAEVLRKYKEDSEKYRLEERAISCRDAWHLQSYDINEAEQVHTYLIYLSRLPFDEQLHWKSFNEAPKAPISKRAYATDIEGEFSVEFDVLSRLKLRVSALQRQNVPWWRLRADHVLEKVRAPVSRAADEWANDILALDQMLVESFDHNWLRKKAEALGRTPDQCFGSLKLVDECLIGLGFDDEHAFTVTAPLRELHNMRTKLKGHISDDSGRALKLKALSEHGSYRAQFLALCGRCDESLGQVTVAFKDA